MQHHEMDVQSSKLLLVVVEVVPADDDVVDDRCEAGGRVGLGEKTLVAHVEMDLAGGFSRGLLPGPHVARHDPALEQIALDDHGALESLGKKS